MRKMKKGVVAQLIYMLVLIAIAVVVGLFFMTVVEKNKKQTSEATYAQISFDATLTGTNTVAILASKNPVEELGNQNLSIYCDNTNVANVSTSDFYPYGNAYRYEFENSACSKGKTLKISNSTNTFLIKVLE